MNGLFPTILSRHKNTNKNNVEVCSGTAAVKYLNNKYMYKGVDSVTMDINRNDEIKQYIGHYYLCGMLASFLLETFIHILMLYTTYLFICQTSNKSI